MDRRALAIFLTGFTVLGLVATSWNASGEGDLDTTAGQAPAVNSGPAIMPPPIQLGAPGPAAASVEDSIESRRTADYSGCKFLARSRENPNIPSNWARVFSGEDLFRDLAVVKYANYSSKGVAVIDTGLDSRKNPRAGRKLRRASADIDFDTHGTHVAGIVASQCCGVNPKLSVRAFPVPYTRPGSSFMADDAGYDGPSLLESLGKAARDPKVGTINLSMSSSDDPQMQALIEEATRNGKYVVFAGGNRTGMGNRENTGLLRLKENPRVFSIGSLSYLGLPSEFSAFGPAVDFFAHGSAVESLSGRYNPNLVGSEATEVHGGTSMAAPDFSAVLQTLQNIAPSVDPVTMRDLLSSTALTRGDRPPVKEINPFLAAKVLSASRDCRDRKRAPVAACLRAAETKLHDSPPKLPRPPTIKRGEPGFCDSGQRYYDRLRRGFFITQGDPRYGSAIRAFFNSMGKSGWAESVYFTGKGQSPALPDVASGAKRTEYTQELKGAASFLKGDQRAASSLSSEEEDALRQSDTGAYLKRLPPGPESIDRYRKACWAYLSAGVKSSPCESFLYSNANQDFIRGLAQQMVNEGRPLSEVRLAVQMGRSDQPDDKELYRKVLSLSARGWAQSKDFDTFRALRARVDDLSPADRTFLIGEARKMNETGVRPNQEKYEWGEADLSATYLDFLSYGTPEEVKGHEAEIRLALTPEITDRETQGKKKKDPTLGALIYEYHRVRAGPTDRAEFLAALDAVLARGRELDRPDGELHDRLQEYGDDRFTTRAVVRAAEADPVLANGIAKRLSNPDALRPFMKYAGGDYVLKELVPILAKPGGDRSLITPLLEAAAQSWSERGQSIYPLLAILESVPEAKAFLDRLKQGRQSDAVLQSGRLDWLRGEVRTAKAATPLIDQYIAEAPAREGDPLLGVNSHLLVTDPRLKAKLATKMDSLMTRDPKGTLHPPKDADRETVYSLPETSRYLELVNRVPVKDLPKLLPLITPRIAGLWRNSNFYAEYESEKLGFAYAYALGSNRSETEAAFHQAEQLLKEPAFLSRPAEDRHNDEQTYGNRDQAVVAFTLGLAKGREGARYWQTHPELAEMVAQRISSPLSDELKLGRERLPPRLLQALTKRLPDDPSRTFQYKDDKPTVRAADWVSKVIEQDPAALERGLRYISEAEVKGQDRVADDFRYAVVALVAAHPELAPRVRAQKDEKLWALLDREER